MAPFFVLDEFIMYLGVQKRFSEHTCLAYRKDLEQFHEFAGINTEQELTEVNSRLVRGWVVAMMDEAYSATSVNRKLSALRTYFRWLLRNRKVESNPVSKVHGPKNEKRLPSFVPKREMDPVRIDQLFADDFEGVRDRLMFEMLYQTGMRSAELQHLKDGDVRTDSVKVLGKRNKERLVPISKELNQLVVRYLRLRAEIVREDDSFFVLNSGKKLYPTFVYRKINNYLGKATELKKKSPHVLRHTFATHMLNNGAGLEVLKELLGHANLSATQIYTHNSFSQLTHIYSQSHPRGQKT